MSTVCKVVISVEKEKDERGYASYEEIYSQKVLDADILAVIKAVNKIGETK